MVITTKEFNQLAAYIEKNYGIHLKTEKKTLVVGRLQHILQEKNFQNFTEYYEYLIQDKTRQAAVTLINNITTNHTFFMREADHFIFFRDQVLPFLKETVKDKDLRIWSAGCSTGEEPYTLSMIINDFFGKEKFWWDTKILATDISEKVLLKARVGRYLDRQIETVPDQWKQNYFKKVNDQTTEIKETIKNEVIFRRFNLIDKCFPFKRKFHVIFCRNVMIYFDNQTKNDLIHRFYECTEPGGFLFIGHSESLSRDITDYKYVIPAVYRKGG
ncbi:CheR family methyltransferase [Sporolactobacillus putidus]|uniref:protein-glutamate O-methyltransferase n=1 Tax=Sporolactobacillus putidus TaxID=492735 RepID=A0A917S619_9BACL|nr:protein-glutamate O-methyltransferase CheR [Sporolactobacillus putidus]GGL57536.1 chemotaxis protein CheR [Sporolactobacillus putidus]